MPRRFQFETPSGKEEGKLEEEKQIEPKIEEVKHFLGEIAEKLRKEEIPVGDDCRVDMEAFEGVYPQAAIREDMEIVKGWQEQWDKEEFGDLPKEEIEKEKLKNKGEQFEMLKTAILYKFLGGEFIVTRTSRFDDIKNKVDNIVLEKETGNLVCALDEVGDIAGEIFEEKQAQVLERNRKEKGGRLKYGIKSEKGKLVMGEVENLPVFYFALPSEYIREGLKNLTPSFEEKSEYEEKLFTYFVASINSQIKSLHLEPYLDPTLKKHLDHFEKSIQKFEKE